MPFPSHPVVLPHRRNSKEAKLQELRDRQNFLRHRQTQKLLARSTRQIIDNANAGHIVTREAVSKSIQQLSGDFVSGAEAHRQGLAENSEELALIRADLERERQLMRQLEEQRRKEWNENQEKQHGKLLAEINDLIRSSTKPPRDGERGCSSPPFKNLFIDSGSAYSNALVSQDDDASSVAAVHSPAALAPLSRRMTSLRTPTPSALRTPKTKAILCEAFSSALKESDLTAATAGVSGRAVKTQDVENVRPKSTSRTARMDLSEDTHIARALEGRDLSRFGRRCTGESFRSPASAASRSPRRLSYEPPRSHHHPRPSLSSSIGSTLPEGKIEKSPPATGTALRARERLRRSTRVRTRAQKKQG